MKKNSKNENFHQFISNPSFFYSPSFIIGTTQGQKRPITLYKNKLANKTISPKVTSCKSVDLGSTNSFLSNPKIVTRPSSKQSEIKKQILNIQVTKTNSVNKTMCSKEEIVGLNVKIENIRDEINEITSKITKNEKKIKEIKEEMEMLKKRKVKVKEEMENLLSQNESLEQIYHTFINDIISNKETNLKETIEITDEDVQLIDIDSISDSIINCMNDITVKTINKGEISKIIIQAVNAYNTDFVIDNFIYSVVDSLFNLINENPITKDNLTVLVKFIIKLNTCNSEITKKLTFINKEYKSLKKSKNIIITELTNVNIQYSNKIDELNKTMSIYNRKFDTITKNPSLSSTSSMITINQDSISNSNHLRLLSKIRNEQTKIEKEIEFSIPRSKSKKKIFSSSSLFSSQPVIKPSKIISVRSSSVKSFKSSFSTSKNSPLNSPKSPFKKSANSTAYNTFFSTSQNDSKKSSQRHSLCRVVIPNLPETFCYYKEIYNKDRKFNPLLSFSKSIENLGYHKGIISLNNTTNTIKITSKGTQTKKEIMIDINNLNKTLIQRNIKDIIQIHKLFSKYDSNKENKVLSISKLINMKEIDNIRMEKNDKIKAALCNHFSFSLVYNDNKERIECIFVDFNDFKLWLNGIATIVNFFDTPCNQSISQKRKNRAMSDYNSFSNFN